MGNLNQYEGGHSAALSGAATKLRDKTSAERKAEPIHSGVLMYFPDALAAIARHSKKANDKHNPGEPLHWSRGKSADHMDSATRHSLTPGKADADTGESELTGMAWRALAQLQLAEEKRLVAAGVMPYSGVTGEAASPSGLETLQRVAAGAYEPRFTNAAGV